MKIQFYLSALLNELLPQSIYQKKFNRLIQMQSKRIESRVQYYCKRTRPFLLTTPSTEIQKFHDKKSSAYYFDLKKHLNYFPKHLKFHYRFGDNTDIENTPFFVKARPIMGNNENAILLKLNQVRHFKFIQDPIPFRQKQNTLVWRGACYQTHRQRFIRQFYNHPMCDVGQTNKPRENTPWQKNKYPISKQLQHKFILAMEGNDVASSLKWTLSSNSLCLMAQPKFETWFMEGKLRPNVHYVQLNDDYSNLEEKIHYYQENPKEAEYIIENAHQFVAQFQNLEQEDCIALHVLKRYFELSGQDIYP
jgi:hypothetical protein